MKGLNILGGNLKISEDEELVGARLERLIFTKPNSIPGEPQVGCFFVDMLWEPMDQITFVKMLDEIQKVVDMYEPNIEIVKILINISSLNPDSEMLTLQMDWNFKGTKEIKTSMIHKIRDK